MGIFLAPRPAFSQPVDDEGGWVLLVSVEAEVEAGPLEPAAAEGGAGPLEPVGGGGGGPEWRVREPIESWSGGAGLHIWALRMASRQVPVERVRARAPSHAWAFS